MVCPLGHTPDNPGTPGEFCRGTLNGCANPDDFVGFFLDGGLAVF
jgi:hypothetical protein